MYTYQMIGIASDNNKTYESKYGTYSKETGFNINDKWKKLIKENINDLDVLLNLLFNNDCWVLAEESKVKKMTIEEIENALGYKIDIVNKKEKGKSEKTAVNTKKGKLTDEQFNDLKNDIKDAFGDIFEFWL